MTTLRDVLEGRRKWLETFTTPAAQGVAQKAARDIVDGFQGLDSAAIFKIMKADYLNLLHQGLNMREKSGNPSSGMDQIDYLIQQLAQLEAWKTAGFPT